MKKQKQRKKLKKKNRKTWLIKVSRQLDKQTRDHVNKYGWSVSGFVKKSVGYLLNSEAPELDGHEKSVTWLIEVHPDFDADMRKLAKANYPSMSNLVRHAVAVQLEREKGYEIS